jgi:hypothetical protein
MEVQLPHEYVLVRCQASLYYLPLLIILHATSYMVFSPGETRKQDDNNERFVAKDKIVHILTKLDGRTLCEIQYIPFIAQNL